jgi:LCP family protein required for cell wall assembly
VVGALLVVAVVAAAGVALFLSSLATSFDGGRHVIPSDAAFPAPSERPAESSGDAQNILLLGSDTRGPAPRSLAAIRGQRSDTMLVLHIPGDGKRAYLISIMRDSWVSIPGHGKGKINAAFSYGGVPLTVRVIEGLLKVRIDHVAVVSFTGFEGLTNALGGVTVDNTIAFDNLGHHFAKGQVRLDGSEALAFVRARYPFADGDYQRVRNQRAYLTAVADRFLSRGTLLNPGRLHDSISTIAPYLLVDSGLDSGYLAQQAVRLRSLSSSDIVSFTAPTDGTGTEGGQSVVYFDESAVADLARHLRNDSMATFRGCSVSIC